MNKVLMVLAAALLAPAANAQVSMLPDPGPRPEPERYLLVFHSQEECIRVTSPDLERVQCWITRTRLFNTLEQAMETMSGERLTAVGGEDVIALIDLAEMRRVPLRLEKIKHVEKREVVEEPWTEYRWRPAP